jgi:hypothetical protein
VTNPSGKPIHVPKLESSKEVAVLPEPGDWGHPVEDSARHTLASDDFRGKMNMKKTSGLLLLPLSLTLPPEPLLGCTQWTQEVVTLRLQGAIQSKE